LGIGGEAEVVEHHGGAEDRQGETDVLAAGTGDPRRKYEFHICLPNGRAGVEFLLTAHAALLPVQDYLGHLASHGGRIPQP
jgi:hypothetical protein